MLLLVIILSLLLAEPERFDEADFHVSEIKTEKTREIILEKAKISLQSLFDDDYHRFDLKARWIPGSLLNLKPENIIDVQLAGPVERNTIFDVTYMQRAEYENAQVQLIVETEYKIPVAIKRITSGETLTAEHLTLKWVPVPYNRDQWMDSIEKLEGKTLKRTLAAGQPIRKIDITSEYIIHAGDSVTMIYEGNGIHLSLKVAARENGSLGDEIKIFCEETRKRYVGKVQNSHTVIWQKTL